ncbi:hypothetical protein ADEAN_000542300 [Angomonas deanei]|uniref:Uncharacterized protein n=1 Tax=Angomonas deanei TaxID=59799 RepID=A0A7G2CFZ4_9TRYP|nr:hypothetical protein ADEAN_000542300 [Angomonas deanei]
MRLKKETIEEKQTKMKGDKAQYLSMMEEERVQSLSEIAELRKELVAELTRCDERYDEEIGKASTEAFQRGRDQGFADGQSGANQENELSAQQLTITIQRLRAEEEALRQRLLSVDREEEKDAKSLTKQLSSLSALQRDLASGNAQAKAKLDELERADSAERANVLFELRSLFSNNPTPFTHHALLSVVDCLARGVPFDASVLKKERDEELRLLEEEKTAVGLWARSTAYNTFSTFPPIRPFFRCDEPHSLNRGPSVLLKIGEEDEESQTTALQRRYQQAISQLNAAEPTLALVP